MIHTISLPPSVTVGPTSVEVSVMTDDGAVVEINLQRLRGLSALSPEEIAHKAQAMALSALAAAAKRLAD